MVEVNHLMDIIGAECKRQILLWRGQLMNRWIDRLRDNVGVALANWALQITTKHYRTMVKGAIAYGLNAAAQDEKLGREIPPDWRLPDEGI